MHGHLNFKLQVSILRPKSEILTAHWYKYNDLQSNFGLGISAWTQNIQYIKNGWVFRFYATGNHKNASDPLSRNKFNQYFN